MDIDKLNMISSRQEQQAPSSADQFLKLVQNPFAAAVSLCDGNAHMFKCADCECSFKQMLSGLP